MTCHAGCELDAIVDALGISAADLFPATEGHRKRARREVAVYDYDGEFEVVRYSPKDFRQRRPDGRGGYVWNIQGVKPRLYHLADLAGCDRVVVAEGEKDVDRLRSLSVPATCNAGGAGKWRPEYSEQLKNAGVRHIVVVPDADEQGRKHGEAVARFCAAAGLEVKKVIPPEGAKDISAYLDAGHDRDDLVKLLETAEAAGQETDRRALPGGCLRVSDPGSDATSADVPPAVARLCLACGRDTDTDPCEHCGLHSEQARLVRVTIGDEADERYRGRGGRLFAARTLLEPFRATDGVVYQAAWPNLDPDMQSLVREALPRDFEFELGGADGAASLIWEHEGKAVPPVVIPGLAWARSTTVFEAGPKWGKTSTLCDAIGQSLTNGRWVSQEVEAPAAPVLYYSEMSVNTLRAWLERRCGNARPEVYADRLKGVRGMRVDAQARTPKLIVVDSLIELLVVNGGGRDECKASDIRAVFVQLRSVFGPEPAILIVNHTRKSDGAGRGSGDVRAVADQIVQMADDEGHVAFNPPEKHRRGRILLYRGAGPSRIGSSSSTPVRTGTSFSTIRSALGRAMAAVTTPRPATLSGRSSGTTLARQPGRLSLASRGATPRSSGFSQIWSRPKRSCGSPAVGAPSFTASARPVARTPRPCPVHPTPILGHGTRSNQMIQHSHLRLRPSSSSRFFRPRRHTRSFGRAGSGRRRRPRRSSRRRRLASILTSRNSRATWMRTREDD